MRHNAHRPPQTLLRNIANILAIDQDTPTCHIVEAVQQLERRGLSGATLAHKRHALVRVDLERHAIQRHVAAMLVRKVHVLELDLAPSDCKVRRARCILNIDFLIQQLHQLVGVDQVLVHHTVQCAQHAERLVYLLQVRHKYDELRRCRGALHDRISDRKYSEQRTKRQNQVLRQIQHVQAKHQAILRLAVRIERPSKAARLVWFVPIEFDRVVVQQHIRRDRSALRVFTVHLATQLRTPRRDPHAAYRIQHHDHQEHTANAPAKDRRHVHHRHHNVHKHGREGKEEILEKVIQRRATVHGADQLARLTAGVVRHGQVQHTIKHEAAHVHVRVPCDGVPQQLLRHCYKAARALEHFEHRKHQNGAPWLAPGTERLHDASKRQRHHQIHDASHEQQRDTQHCEQLQTRRLARP